MPSLRMKLGPPLKEMLFAVIEGDFEDNNNQKTCFMSRRKQMQLCICCDDSHYKMPTGQHRRDLIKITTAVGG